MRIIKTLPICVLLPAVIFQAQAQEVSTNLPALATWNECGALENDNDRLSCFDKVLANANAAVVENAAVDASPPVLAATETAEEDKENFGLSELQRAEKEDATPDPVVREKLKKERENKKTLRAKVVQRYQTLRGKFVLVLDNGQIWEETDNSNLRLPKRDLEVIIKRGFLGNYKLKVVDHVGSASVKRVQ